MWLFFECKWSKTQLLNSCQASTTFNFAFLTKYIISLQLLYCHSNTFNTNDIQKISYIVSSRLYLSPCYGGFTRKILVFRFCPKLLNSKIYIEFWKCGSVDEVTLDGGLNSSVDLIISKNLRVIAFRLKSWFYEIVWMKLFVMSSDQVMWPRHYNIINYNIIL